MIITGIIAEYNPFHTGHAYHIRHAKALTGADAVIVVMSGNFTQRGTPAILDKQTRTRMALACGADLVLELPVRFACASAEYFAGGAVSILDQLHCVDYLCFGSESGRIGELEAAAQALLSAERSPLYQEKLKDQLRLGQSFPAARSRALSLFFGHSEENAFPPSLLQTPNDILGVEYLKALKRLNSSIHPVAIPRLGSGYHEETLNMQGPSSATAIRAALSGGGNPSDRKCSDTGEASARERKLDSVRASLPQEVLPIWDEVWDEGGILTEDDFSALLHYRLLTLPRKSRNAFPTAAANSSGSDRPGIALSAGPLSAFADVSCDLADKIERNLYAFQDWRQFCSLLHSRDLTYTRVSRCLAHILLDIRQEALDFSRQNNFGSYARMLGFSRQASSLLSCIKRSSALPLISKLADADGLLSPEALSILEEEIRASHIYRSVYSQKYGKPFINEYQRQIIISP